MANRTYVKTEIVGTTTTDVNDAIRNGTVMDGEVSHYQVTLNAGFRLEDAEEPPG